MEPDTRNDRLKYWIKKWGIGEISGGRMLLSHIESHICILVLAWFFSDRLLFIQHS